MRRTALAILRNAEDAEDVAQEAALRAFTKINSFQGNSAFSTWLNRIVINTCLMRLRHRRARPSSSLDELMDSDRAPFLVLAASGPDPEQQYCDAELRRELYRAVNRLPDGLREVIKDKIYGEATVQDLAGKRGLTVGAVKSRVHRGQKILMDQQNRKSAHKPKRKFSGG
jgi:RNA polymerase sigma-70 factor, ECF subfamily